MDKNFQNIMTTLFVVFLLVLAIGLLYGTLFYIADSVVDIKLQQIHLDNRLDEIDKRFDDFCPIIEILEE